MKSEYLKRYIDEDLKKYLNAVGAVLIDGPKWCGKTTTAKQHANSVLELQDPDKAESYLELASIKPSKLLEGDTPRLIDEWQMAPVIWDAVRYSVDKLGGQGLYILTGSTSVDESKIMHSGTGRIHRMHMMPMSLYESKDSNGKISVMDLFDNPELDIDGLTSDLSIEDLIFVTCRGGWPETLNIDDDSSKLLMAYSYIESICESEASTIDGVKRNPERVKVILKSYARNISTLARDKTIMKDVFSQFGDISYPTFISYVDALKRLYVIKNIQSWSPNIRSSRAIKSTPKKEFIDPSIAVASLELTPDKLLFDLKSFGFIFENLCFRDLAVYSYSRGGKLYYYHDRYDLEVDCVLTLSDGKYALIEFKVGRNEIDDAANNLKKLKNVLIEDGVQEPSFLAVVYGGELAYTRRDGVKVLPIGCLR
ncbi:ATP-binding protein [Methanobrevibacter sp.]|uniref:ATP-binding protein n=1 Tax=Methanobrevibacter sp. TaxID=66852 RepID=UPI003864955A